MDIIFFFKQIKLSSDYQVDGDDQNLSTIFRKSDIYNYGGDLVNPNHIIPMNIWASFSKFFSTTNDIGENNEWDLAAKLKEIGPADIKSLTLGCLMELIQQALDRGILLCINKNLIASTVATSPVYWPLIEAATQLERQLVMTTSPIELKINVRDIFEFLQSNKADMRFIYGENNTLLPEAASLNIDLSSTEKGIEQYILMACRDNFLKLYQHPQTPQVSIIKTPLFPVKEKLQAQNLIDLTALQEEEDSDDDVEKEEPSNSEISESKKRRRRRKRNKKAVTDVLDKILEIN